MPQAAKSLTAGAFERKEHWSIRKRTGNHPVMKNALSWFDCVFTSGRGGRHCPACLIFGLWLRELREHDESCCSLGYHLICWAVVRSFRYRLMSSILTFSNMYYWTVDHTRIKLCSSLSPCCQYLRVSEEFIGTFLRHNVLTFDLKSLLGIEYDIYWNFLPILESSKGLIRERQPASLV